MLTVTEKKLITPFIRRAARLELARRNFWDYCQLVEADFYQPHRHHLKEMCLTLNNFYYGLPLDSSGRIYEILMINMPPRFGKTRTLVNFTDWILGKNERERVIVCSYNDDTASDFSKFARDGIQREKLDPNDILFNDVFPNTRIRKGSAAQMKWALEGQHFNYLASGIGGSVTGKGASVRVVDDLIKGAKQAFTDTALEDAWQFLSSTLWSRRDPEAKRVLTILCMTRWAKKDPSGRLLELFSDKIYQLVFEAYDAKTDTMLCAEFLNKKAYEEAKQITEETIFMANYHQRPIDIIGRMYSRGFKTYSALPVDENGNILFERIKAYVDTADEGDDYLCSIIYGVYQGAAYVLDVYYTKDAMEVTEPELARRLVKFRVNAADVESNSGGRGFARNLKRILWEVFKTKKIVVRWFHQTQNKKSRIFTQSASVQEVVMMPVDWRWRWPEFYEHVTSFQKDGKPANDDAEDALTGMVEKMDEKGMEILK